MMSVKGSPIVKAAAVLGARLVMEDLAHRCEQIENTPLGEFFKRGMQRHKMNQEAGRPWTSEDLEELLAGLPGLGGKRADGG
jgi:hypothetical protein